MMRVPIRIEYVDGERETIRTSPADAVAFEREFDKPVTAIATGRAEYFWWIAWHACKRARRTELPFDEWLDRIESVVEDETEPADIVPLDPDPLTGSSAMSPTSST